MPELPNFAQALRDALTSSLSGRRVGCPGAGWGWRRADVPFHKGGKLFLGTTKVEDFDRWWSVFSTTSLEKRKEHGCKGSHTFRDPNEEGRVWVLFDWDAEGWQNFISDPDVPAILQEAGHATKPQVAEFAGQLDG
jgi:hypothetical protein